MSTFSDFWLNDTTPEKMSSLVANYSDSEPEHSDDDDDIVKTPGRTENVRVETEKKDINFLTAEFSESEDEGEC